MTKQPEALRLADWLDGSSNGPMDARHKAAAELRRLHEANEAFASRQTWWNNRMFEMEAALRQAQEPVAWVYAEGLQALNSGKPWVAYGRDGDGRIPLYLHNDAVAPRVEPRLRESGAGFESLPASPQWQGLTADEIWACNVAPAGHHVESHICVAHQNVLDFAEAIEAKLKEKNT